MPSRESLHTDLSRHVLVPQTVAALDTTALDLLNYEAGSLIVDIAAANLAAAVYATLTPMEADVSTGPWTNIDPLYCEWFQDGVPGQLQGALGAQVWTPSTPGGSGPLVLATELNVTNHTYGFSYVGGQHRYIRLHCAITGAPTNIMAVIGLVGKPRETAPKVFTNWSYP
jgi:hypothetical protein